MNGSNLARAKFRTARDELLALRSDYERAVASFRWPEVDCFNWALDWFDGELAQGPTADKLALRIVGDAAASGLFRAGDQDNFAQAIVRTYRLEAVHREQEIILAGGVARGQ